MEYRVIRTADYDDELYHFGVKGMKWGRRKSQYDGSNASVGKKKIEKTVRYSNRQIKRDMNKTFDNTYKKLHEQYKKGNSATAADRAYTQARKINTKHLIDTYGKERMDRYYSTERKKTIAAGAVLVGSLASMSVVTLIANRTM